MPWASNPLFRPREATTSEMQQVDPEAATPRQVILQGIKNTFREPSDRLTGHQFLYIFVVDGICAAVISAGINFAIGYAMYIGKRETEFINVWQFPTTLAGDTAITIIIQCIITWLIELLLVNGDLKKGSVQPIGFLEQPANRFCRWFLFLDRAQETHEVGGLAHWLRFLVSQVLRAFLVSVVCFCLVWAPCVGVLMALGTPNGGDWTFDEAHKWFPPIFKCVLGGVLGLLTTPLFTIFWMVRCGWALMKDEKHYGQTRQSGEWNG